MTLMIEKEIYFEHDGFVISKCTYEDRIILGNFINNDLNNGLIRYNNGIIIFGTFNNNNGLHNGIIYYPGNNKDHDTFFFQSGKNQLLQKFKLLQKPMTNFTHRIINGYFGKNKNFLHGYIEAYYENGSKNKKDEKIDISFHLFNIKHFINIIDNNIVISCLHPRRFKIRQINVKK